MNISNKMIHPEIRTIGKIIRFIIPYFKTSTFKLSRHIIGVLKKKSCKDMCYEQIYIPRKERRVTEDLLRICVYSPFERKKKATGILWIHGGGYGLGVPEQDEAFIRRFVLTYNCVVVSPDYCLSTIAPYPAALEDCYTALMWLKENAALYDICPNQLMVGGDSAGGGLTAALTIYARDKREVAIAFQMPLYPMLDDRMITKSSQNNDAPVWNTKSNENAWKLYLGSLYGTEDISPYAAPARLTDFSNLPPAVTYVGDLEPFYDETVNYMEQLKAAGVSAKYKVFTGCYHAFDIMAGKTTPAKEAVEFLMKNFEYAQNHYFKEQPFIV